jgi:hypothetical protein
MEPPQETNIQIIRIPEYGKAKTKTDKWKEQFKTFVVNKLNGYLGNQQESEQTKTLPLQKAAYKIIRLLKK